LLLSRFFLCQSAAQFKLLKGKYGELMVDCSAKIIIRKAIAGYLFSLKSQKQSSSAGVVTISSSARRRVAEGADSRNTRLER